MIHQGSIPQPSQLPKAVIFDWDNTLVDTWRTCYEAYNTTLKTFHRPLCTPEDFTHQPHQSAKDSFPRHFGGQHKEAEEYFYRQIHETHLENLRPLPGSEKLLQLLLSQRVYLAVVSNKHGVLLRREVAHLEWGHYFGNVVGSCDTAEDKPSPLPVFESLKKTNITPGQDVWFVGDSPVDMLCSRNANCVPIYVNSSSVLEDLPFFYGKDCLSLASIVMDMI